MSKAIFGRPINAVSVGGAHVGVDVITLHKGKLVLFEKPGLRPAGQDLGELIGKKPERPTFIP